MTSIQEKLSALIASGEFDPHYYATAYPDVSETGLDPAEHFLWIGARLGRLGRPVKDLHASSRPDRLDVLFVDGTNGTSSTQYRVHHVARGLTRCGLNVDYISGDELRTADWESLLSRFVVFFRAPFWEQYSAFAEAMRVNGSTIVYDIDDLVFDEELIPIIDGYRWLSEPEKLGYVRGVRAYREFLLYADVCTAPTEFLADQMRALGKRAFRVRNTLAESEIGKFRAKLPARAKRERFVVGYYSGSKTHQADFRNAGEALADFMDENPSVDFRLVGAFDLFEYPRLQKWSQTSGAGPRVRQVGLMPHSQMLEDQLECDLIIAPLEVGNAFCEAKSELKFFEAGLVRRPTIASPTRTFREASADGQYCQLADYREEWLRAYSRAFRGKKQTHAQANEVHEYVIREYAPAAAGADALAAYSGSLISAWPPFSSRSAVANSDAMG